MGIITAVGLLVIAVALFLTVRIGWISNATLQRLANIASILAMLAAIGIFVVPTPQPVPTPTPTPTSIPVIDDEPNFVVSAINTLAGNKVYETTNHFRGIDSESGIEGITINWGLEIIPEYSNTTSYGEVRILVKNAQGKIVAQNKWDDLNKDSKKLFIDLNPYELSNEVEGIDLSGGFRENIFKTETFEPPEAIFDIEIVRASDLSSPLLNDKLIIKNSPWYHYTTLSAWNGNSIAVYVYGKNLGDASDFAVMGEIYEITEIPGTMWKPWPRLGFQQKVLSVEEGEEFTVELTFPEGSESVFEFERGKTYLVHTYLVKRQNYIEFDRGTWDTDGERWRLGSFGNRLLVARP